MSHQNDINNLIRRHRKRLQKLKEHEAVKGISTDPSILTEIEDIEAKIEILQEELADIANLEGKVSQPDIIQEITEVGSPFARFFGKVGLNVWRYIVITIGFVLLCILGLLSISIFKPVIQTILDLSTPSITTEPIPIYVTPTATYTPIPAFTPIPTWELSYDSPSYQIRDLALYKGKLYAAGLDYGLKNGKLYEYDGSSDECNNSSWKDITGKFGATVDTVESLQFFNDRLYIGTRVDNRGKKEARVYYYDSKDITLDFSTNGMSAYSGIVDFVIHNNALYAANEAENGGVYRRDHDHEWGKIITGSVRSLASYDGSLYLGSWGPGVWRWKTDSPEQVKDFKDGQFEIKELDSVWSLEAFNNKLYVGLTGSQADTVLVPAFEGKDWKPVDEEIDSSGYTKLVVIDDRLWMVADRGQVFTLEDTVWKKLPTISEPNADGVQSLALYNDFLYAGTFTEGRIYCISYLK